MIDINKFKIVINDLINLRKKQCNLLNCLNNKKDASAVLFRIKNYEKWLIAIDKMKNITINSSDDIKNLKGVSDKLKIRLLEFLETNTITDIKKVNKEIAKLDETFGDVSIEIKKQIDNNIDELQILETSDPKYKKKKTRGDDRPTSGNTQVIFDLQRIIGIGPSNAKKLFTEGITLQNLLEEWAKFIKNNPKFNLSEGMEHHSSQFSCLHSQKPHNIQNLLSATKYLKNLNHHQLVGIKYFEDVEKRIPRPELERMEKLIITVAKKIDKKMNITICGSYRRKCDTSGDIDMLLTHDDCQTKEDITQFQISPLAEFVRVLSAVGFLTDHLTIDGNTKYMGMCALPDSPFNRRIDIRFVPMNCYSSALVYFTGSWNFNVEMRKYAMSKGYSLSEYGLTKKSTGQILPFKTEKDLFEFLKYPYKEPWDRNL